MKKVVLVILLYCAQFDALAQQSESQVFESIPVLHGDTIAFPITLVDAFPFISVTVNGIKGKFMFDTGLASAIEINDNAVKLPAKKRPAGATWAAGSHLLRI